MSDLTDEELEMACTVSDRLQTINHRAYVDREALAMADRLQRAAAEIGRHRTAIAADNEMVRAVVREAVRAVSAEVPGRDVWYPVEHASAVADRVAEQLTSPIPALSEHDVKVISWIIEDASACHRGDLIRRTMERVLRQRQPPLGSDDARELAERRSLDQLRMAEIEELVTRRQADLSTDDIETMTRHVAWLRERHDGHMTGTIHENVIALLDRLIGGAR